MSRRYIDPDIWVKLYGTPSSAKLVAVYLQATSPNPAGIFRVRPEEIAMNTGLKVAEVVKGLEELHQRSVVLWDQDETMVFLTGYSQVQGINPKVARSINSELVRLGPSPLTVQAARIPQLRSQDPEGWDRVSIEYAEAMDTLQSVSLSVSEGGEPERGSRGKPRKKPWVEQLLDAMREEWPRDEEGRLYRFDRANARRELIKISADDKPEHQVVVEGVKRWRTVWDSNGFQHKASRFVSDRLWEQSAVGPKKKPGSVTSRSLFKGEDT